MTPQQIDTITNGLITVHDTVAHYGPGLTAAATAAVAWWAIPRIARRAATRRGIRRLEHYANHPGARTNHQPRKEKP